MVRLTEWVKGMKRYEGLQRVEGASNPDSLKLVRLSKRGSRTDTNYAPPKVGQLLRKIKQSITPSLREEGVSTLKRAAFCGTPARAREGDDLIDVLRGRGPGAFFIELPSPRRGVSSL